LNELLLSLGLIGWKPILTALLLPPVPWIVMVFVGARWLGQQRLAGWLLVLPACFAMWFSATSAVGDALGRGLLAPPPPLGEAEVSALKAAHAARPGETAIVVLGGGREALAPEYGVSNLNGRSVQRLRYGLWLSRATGAPLAFSGGVGHGARGEVSEAEVAARIAMQEFGRPLKWTETRSRDTRENASFTVGLLRPQGVRQIVVVTHAWHMRRALRAFEEAVAGSEGGITITGAPMGTAQRVEMTLLRWLPSSEGLARVRDALREWAGWLAGA
jgi:uncharacterized SAM-binding protein YcdF (DUF218 family)